MWSRARGPADSGADSGAQSGGRASASSAAPASIDESAAAGAVGDLDPLRRRRSPAVDPKATLRKIYLRCVPVCCLICLVTFVDRANIALAAPVLLGDIGLTRAQFGLASAIMFVTYGLFMSPSALMFTVVSLRKWFAAIVVAWGVVTALTGAIAAPGLTPPSSFAVLVALRLLLGAAEAGTMPGCFFLLSRFLPKKELAYAYSWVLVFTVMAQVFGAPLGALFIGPLDRKVFGLRGWELMFLAEGLITALFGLSILFLVSDSIAEAKWLTADEKAWALSQVSEGGAGEEDEGEEEKAEATSEGAKRKEQKQSVLAAAKDALQVVRSKEIWVLGVAIMMIQFAFFAVTFFAPLLIADTFSPSAAASSALKSSAESAKAKTPTAPSPANPQEAANAAMMAALKSTAVYAPSAATLVLAGALCRATGDRKFQCLALLTASAVGFALIPFAAERGSPGGALACLVLGSCGGVGALAAITTWPQRYLTGKHEAAEYGFWNSFVSVGGFGGPFLMGATSLRTSTGIMAAFQVLAAAILLAFGFVEERRDAARKESLEEGRADGSGRGRGPAPGEASGVGSIL